MKTKYGFTKMSISEFKNYIQNLRVARTIITLQQHHTYNPDYALFNGNNHFELQKGMKNYHVYSLGWMDIGQHFTIFPDGTILTGRSIEYSPACIYGQNQHVICIENLGNFDIGGDIMNTTQKEAIVKATAAICFKFNIPVNADKIVYHHWFQLGSGVRNNGSGGNKSCPGTNFFGGNKVEDCESNFLPLINQELNGQTNNNPNTILKYVSVTASSLNVRIGPNTSNSKTSDRAPATYGSILRVYDEQSGWLKISGSKDHWVYARYTEDVIRATVNATVLNVRNLPGVNGLKIGAVSKDTEVFIYEEQNNWCRISVEEKWVSKRYLNV